MLSTDAEVSLDLDSAGSDAFGSLSGHLMSGGRELFRSAFMRGAVRLEEPVYRCVCRKMGLFAAILIKAAGAKYTRLQRCWGACMLW